MDSIIKLIHILCQYIAVIYRSCGFFGFILVVAFVVACARYLYLLIDYCINDPHGDLRPPKED